MKRTTRC